MKLFSKTVIISTLLFLTACGGTDTKEVEVIKEVEKEVIVEVEKQPFKLTGSLTAFGYTVQDDYEVVVNDGEIPENIYVQRPMVSLYHLSEDNQWLDEVEYEISLDGNEFTIDIYEPGTYALRVYANHYSTDGSQSNNIWLQKSQIVNIHQDVNLDIGLITYTYDKELAELNFTGLRTATIVDYLNNIQQICFVSTQGDRFSYFRTETQDNYFTLEFFCKSAATLSQMNFAMQDEFEVQILWQGDLVYSGSDIVFPNIELNRGKNFVTLKVEVPSDIEELSLQVGSVTIDSNEFQQVEDNIAAETRVIVEKAEFFVPDTNEVVLLSLYDSLVIQDVCTNQQSFKINGELVQADYYSNKYEAYCYQPTGSLGSNIFLNIFPRTEVGTQRGWIFESDEPGLKLIYVEGRSQFTNDEGEYTESFWSAE